MTRMQYTQYGVIFSRKFQNGIHATMEDVTHDYHDNAVREALWLTHEGMTVLSLFCVNMKTGVIVQLLDANDIQCLHDMISHETWEYFRDSKKDIPFPTNSLVAALKKVSA